MLTADRPEPPQLPSSSASEEAALAAAGGPGAAGAAPGGAAAGGPPARRRPMHRVTGIGLWSVAKVSLVVYAVVGLALVTAAVLLALVLQSSGLTIHIDRFARRVAGLKSVSLRPAVVAEATAAFAAALAVIGVLVHVLGAFIYNRIAELTGGAVVRLGQEAEPPSETLPQAG